MDGDSRWFWYTCPSLGAFATLGSPATGPMLLGTARLLRMRPF